MIDKEIIEKSLKNVIEQKSGKDVISLGIISSIVIKGGHVGFALEVSKQMQLENMEELRKRCEQAVRSIPGVMQVTVVGTTQTDCTRPKLNIEGVKKVIVIASGKGGVGKSSVALHLALALAQLEYNAALVDADIYGPSIPQMLGTENLQPEISRGKFIPIEKHGIQTISIGYLIDKSRAAIWRGPMVTKALYNLLIRTEWSNIEYLIIDTPPGTGDVHLSLMEKFNLTGVVMVSTPQKLALLHVRKTYDMFKKLNVPIIGIIENMSYFIYNGSKVHIFGTDGTEKFSRELEIKLLGCIPIDPQICQASDHGNPLSVNKNIAKIYRDIAQDILKQLI